MSVMLYKEGKGTRVWGKEYQTVVVRDDELSDYKSKGWKEHPDEVKAKAAEDKPIKRTRRTNAEEADKPQKEVSDETDNEG
ncbi:hypothetical protein A6J33_018025 [Pantoea sp. FDAARGOS_194]|uniref:hypothetical protein n=1 Tax=Pantoea TaxID=53335 RepID=UPI000660189D|nr:MULTISPECIES: hypothetical protein [Pantoea]PNK64543.1 hypothetical protein A6J33_018025 [Pantoea sp. FDAARGOS_194]